MLQWLTCREKRKLSERNVLLQNNILFSAIFSENNLYNKDNGKFSVLLLFVTTLMKKTFTHFFAEIRNKNIDFPIL